MDAFGPCFPLLGILFAFVVGARLPSLTRSEALEIALRAFRGGTRRRRVCASRLVDIASVVVLTGTIRRPKV